MKSEGDYKRIIKASCEDIGGVAFLLEGLYQKGVPDMHITIPTSWPTLAEVKLERKCGLKFNRKIKYSKLQSTNLNAMWKANILAALGMVVCEIDTDVALVALPPYETHVRSNNMKAFVWLEDDMFDMTGLFKKYRKAFINPEHATRTKIREKSDDYRMAV